MTGTPHRKKQRSVLMVPALCLAVALLGASSAGAQQLGDTSDNPGDVNASLAGRSPGNTEAGQYLSGASIATSSVGTAGQRQGQNQAARIQPMGRLNTRIANRVQSRIRNRIDRFYDPQANATSPFEVAADQEKITATTGR